MNLSPLPLALVLVSALPSLARAGPNLLPDPSIEETKPPDQFGNPFARWQGYKFEGAVAFANGNVAHSGKTSATMIGAVGGKIRLYSPPVAVDPGRYRFSCYIRGLDVGEHAWHLSEDVNFVDDHYYPLRKSGTFGWTRLEIVKDVPARQDAVARIGLWAPGRLWVDDASLERVPESTPLTDGPVLGEEEAPVRPPAAIDPAVAVHCPDCGYLNMPNWGRCYACGAPLTGTTRDSTGPPVRPLASFEDGTARPFDGGTVVTNHATRGKHALRVEKQWVSWDGPQDWTGYDFFEVDVFNPADDPQNMTVEIRDRETRDYWTRVNYNTVLPPGPSTLVMPTAIYVGEKSRPGRMLDRAGIVRLVLSIDGNHSPVYFDNLRLERDLSDRVRAPGLRAFDFGPGTMPPFPGFTAVTPSTLYSPGRGYGLKDAHIWQAFDVLQPDPLYETFLCIESGGFAIDLPDGRYHVWVNTDSPSGFWGEFQKYRTRTIKANGKVVAQDTMNLASFRQRYYRYADVDDSPSENTFDKYQRSYFHPKEFDFDVTGGQLYLEFLGENWAQSVSALVIYPAAQAEAGRNYLENLQERRRFYFDNYFKRVLPNPHRDARGPVPDFQPGAQEQARGYVLFTRDWMEEIPVNAIPRRVEVGTPIDAFASAGQMEPLVFLLYPLRDCGLVKVSVSPLKSGPSVVPASAVQPGVVSHRITRVTGEGTVYSIAPRFILPRDSADIRKGTTTTFWLTLHTPRDVKAGIYTGRILLTFANGKTDSVPVRLRLFATPLDELDVAAGPWGCSIGLPWYPEDLGDYDRTMYRKCLAELRAYGCTTFSGIPTLSIQGWREGIPLIDFRRADQEMADAKAAGFHRVIVNYNGGIGGFDNYHIDEAAMHSAGFSDYVTFLRAVLTTVQDHARAAGWLPVAYNLCDEPIGDARDAATANAKAWREAAPPDMLTTGATSVESAVPGDPALLLAQSLKAPNLNGHNEASVKAIHDAGSDWGFYNGGSRWTFGAYLFKCVHPYGMKFRLSWHFNATAGDPYYALDCREDDYSWVATNDRMELIPTIHFDREIRAGIDDYRSMETLDRLVREHPDRPGAADARHLLEAKLAAFKLGDRDHDALWPFTEYRTFRLQLAEAIERLSAAK